MSVFLNFSGKTFALANDESIQTQIITLFQNLHIDSGLLTYRCNNKSFSAIQKIQNRSIIQVSVPLLGGKGGYGAKLKNQGGKKVRPNDNRFSRDAQGRRIQYQMAERQYTEFVKKKMQEDEIVSKQRQQFKIMQQTMKQGSSFMKLDKKYNQEVQKTQNQIAQSIRIGREKLLANKAKINGINNGNLTKTNGQSTQQNEEKKQRIDEPIQKAQYQSEKQEKKEASSQSQEEEKQEKQIEQIQKPIKKIKSDVTPIQQKLPVPTSFVSAKDKLKSLFKK